MKLLVVSGSDETYNLISVNVRPLGFELIRYQHVLKAMDNIDEADPAGIIISARDFPRHWKAMVQFVRSGRPKDACPIILLKGDAFPVEDTSQAFYLGVSGIVAEDNLDNPAEVDRLQAILGRYMPIEERRRTPRIHTESHHRINFVFTNPADNTLVTGDVKSISSGGLSFLPQHTTITKDLTLNMELPECSLRTGDAILSPTCRLARTGRIISMEFLTFPPAEKQTLNHYLETLPLLDLKSDNR